MATVRINSNAYESGETYLVQLQDEVEKNFAILLSLLSSYWKSTVDGPNYARSMKAMAIALSQIRLSLGEIFSDSEYSATRGEFLNQVVTRLVFPGEAPDLRSSDVEFRNFMAELVPLYFKGSVPDSVAAAVKLLTGGDVRIYEMFEEARRPGSGFDISDEFMFGIDVFLNLEDGPDALLLDRNVRIILQIMRPAHTLYKFRFVLRDEYVGNRTDPVQGRPFSPNKVLDSRSADITGYSYEDFRKFSLGVRGVDPLGAKVSRVVTGEPHTF